MSDIRCQDHLFFLRRRPRCVDGSLNLSSRVNKSFNKDSQASNYYDPLDPSINIDQGLIEAHLDMQQEAYDDARFEELTARVKKLERERSALVKYKDWADRYIRRKREELKKL